MVRPHRKTVQCLKSVLLLAGEPIHEVEVSVIPCLEATTGLHCQRLMKLRTHSL